MAVVTLSSLLVAAVIRVQCSVLQLDAKSNFNNLLKGFGIFFFFGKKKKKSNSNSLVEGVGIFDKLVKISPPCAYMRVTRPCGSMIFAATFSLARHDSSYALVLNTVVALLDP